MALSGYRHKQYMVYLTKDETETTNSYNTRLWFVLRNMNKHPYDDLVIMSKYYYNSVFKGMQYPTSIEEKLKEYL
ncbi:hypothetical protein QKU58_gp112 [Pyramimonas orientalis virus]|uniref:XRN2-binding (XTBD) domain-containing protein n=1 Tax=Pyramimonas orientalis virus 01B TaxID=3134525 RepID=A0A7L9AXE7_9VIRU|nr:hypothetical protein QKU58_gp112 [Pyramimonas orientalis virus]QOI90219.1 hypothetical protein HWQ62_00082 [Pyramimonas orientalis virus]